MDLQQINNAAQAYALEVFGAFHPTSEDNAPAGTGTMVLLGPRGRLFWDEFRQSPEFLDGQKDPIDRWSVRTVSGIAETFGGKALFPFGGPPYLPFISWAKRSRAWASPVGILVHDTAGLFVSYRGAIALTDVLNLPDASPCPCDTCHQPCRSACPASALTDQAYDVPLCHQFLDTPPGNNCMLSGCEVRRACPVGKTSRSASQSAFHMASFHARH